MAKDEKQILADRALARSTTGLYFLDDSMPFEQGGTDGAYSRSRYLILAYNFELILNSLFILASQKTSREEIINELIIVAKKHDFAQLFSKIPSAYRSEIKSVARDETSGFTEYKVELNSGHQFIVQDLIDVRYDFKKDFLRRVNTNEVAEIKKTILELHKIIKLIRTKNQL